MEFNLVNITIILFGFVIPGTAFIWFTLWVPEQIRKEREHFHSLLQQVYGHARWKHK